MLPKAHLTLHSRISSSRWMIIPSWLSGSWRSFLYRVYSASLVAQRVKRLPAMWETWVWSLGWEDPLEKEMANHSSMHAWRIPWTEEPGRLLSMRSQRLGHDWSDLAAAAAALRIKGGMQCCHPVAISCNSRRNTSEQGNWKLPSLTCQQIWKTQQWPQDWKRSVFIPIPKKGNAKECSNYLTIALISHASKVMLKILQGRLQQYVNKELPDDQVGFGKGRGTRDQIVNIP